MHIQDGGLRYHGMADKFTCLCMKRDCLNTTCLNGGVCFRTDAGEVCSCPNTYHGRECEIKGPCSKILCKNVAPAWHTLKSEAAQRRHVDHAAFGRGGGVGVLIFLIFLNGDGVTGMG